MDNEVALKTALAAVLYEAKLAGCDIESICAKAKSGLFDSSKPYRAADANVVVPAQDAIDEALTQVSE